jgi:AsmA protein
MRLIRYALYGLGGVVLLLAALVAYVALVFDPNAHKQDLERVVREQTGREFRLEGALKLSVFPWLALDVGQARLGNAPGFGAEPMVEFEHARLGVKLLPLLHRRLEIGAVTLRAPRIRLAVDAAGHSNWADLAKGKHAEATTPGAGGATELSIAQLQITDGELEYVDRSGAGSKLAVHGLALATGAFSGARPFDLHLAGTVQKGEGPSVALKLSSRATLDLDASRYQLAAPEIDLQLKGAGFPAAGLPVQLRFESIDADLKAQTVQLPGLDLRLAGARFSGALAGTQLLDAPSFTGKLALADTSLRELLKSLDIELPATRDPKSFGRVGFEGSIGASARALMLTDLRLRLDDTTATGRAGVSDLAAKALAFDLKLDRLNADRYLAPVSAAQPGVPAAPAAPTPIPVALIRSLNLHGTVGVGEAVFAGIQYRNLHLGINAGGGRLRVYPSEAQMYGGQYHGDINVDASGRLPRVSFDEHVDRVDFAPLFQDMFQSRRVSGRGSGAIKAAGVGADSAALLRSLTGTLEFHVDNGAFEGTDLWYEIRRARALLKQQPVPARTGPERTPFTAVSATGRITNGVVANDDLIAALQYLQVKGRGTADIGAGTLDYHLDVVVLKIPEGQADSAAMSDMAGFTVPVAVTGSFAAPKVRPDLEGLVKARVRQELDKKKEQLKQQLQDKLKDKLQGLFGH